MPVWQHSSSAHSIKTNNNTKVVSIEEPEQSLRVVLCAAYIQNGGESDSYTTDQEHIVDFFEIARCLLGRVQSTKNVDRQKNAGQNMETDGQSGATVSTIENEFEK